MENIALQQHQQFFTRSRKWVPNFSLDKDDDKLLGVRANRKLGLLHWYSGHMHELQRTCRLVPRICGLQDL